MPPSTHLPPWRTFSIFISSTFLDMQAERDHLKNIVFPKIEDELNKKRIRLEIVDLRWGVNTDDIVDEGDREKEVLKVVLDEIKRCRPFFIGLLGDRYGWMPPEERMKMVVEKEGLSIKNKDKSVTALEIEFGVLASKEQLDRSVFYFREPLDYTKMSPKQAARYSDAHDPALSDEEKTIRKTALDDLKINIRQHFEKQNQPDKVKSYPASWDPGKEKVTGLEAWGDRVEQHILKECQKHAIDTWDQVPQNWIEQELAMLDAFVERHTHVMKRELDGILEEIPSFCGREVLLAELKEHLLSSAGGPWGLVLTGESGSGKSAVFAMLNKMMQAEDCLVLAHSAGLSSKSNKVSGLLEIWNRQLADFLNIEEEPESEFSNDRLSSLEYPGDTPRTKASGIEKAIEKFREKLFTAAEKKRVILLVDALDRFESTPRALYLSWLPDVLPPNIRLLATAISGTETKALEYHKGLSSKNIDYLSPAEASSMLETLCMQAHKTLPAQAKKAILENKIDLDRLASSSPLWLSLAVNIMMAMDQDDFEKINQNRAEDRQALEKYMESMAGAFPSLPGPLFIELLDKAGKVFGPSFTRAVFECIACSRYGLRESDLENVVPATGASWDALVFANIRRWFGNHLVLGGGDMQWDLAHNILRTAMFIKLGHQGQKVIHTLTANHFLVLDKDPLKSTEVMHHLLRAGLDKEAAWFYAGNISEEENAGSMEAFTEIILNESSGLDKISSLPGLIPSGDWRFYDISHKYIFDLSLYLATEGNLNQRLFLLNELKEQINFPYSRKIRPAHCELDSIFLIIQMGEIYQELGKFDKALEYFKICFQIANERYEVNPEDEDMKKGLAIANEKMGVIYKALGQYGKALESFEKSNLLIKKLSEDNPISDGVKGVLAISYNNLGEIYQALGKYEQALKCFENDNRIMEELYEANSISELNKINLSASYGKLGDLLQTLDQYEKALEYLEKDNQIIEELYEANPQNEKIKSGLAASYFKLGDTHLTLGHFEQSLEYLEKGNQITKEIYEANSIGELNKINLSASYGKLGDLHKALGQYGKALEYFEESNQIAKEIYEANSIGELNKNNLAASYFKLGDTHLTLGHFEQSLEYLEKGNQITKEIYETNSIGELNKNNLAISYEKLGDVHQALDRYGKALEYFEEFNQIAKELHEAYPISESYKNSLANSYFKLGDMLLTSGHFEQSLECFENYNQIIKELYRVNPISEISKNNLAISYGNLGEIHKELGQLGQALQCFQQQIILLKELYESNPNNESLEYLLAISYTNLGEIYQGLGQFDQALQFVQQLLFLIKKLYEFNPKNENLKNGLANSYEKVGDIHVALGQFDQAQKYYKQNLNIIKELYENNSENIQFLEDLAVSYYKLSDLSSITGQKITGEVYLKEFVRICNKLYEITNLEKYKEWLEM